MFRFFGTMFPCSILEISGFLNSPQPNRLEAGLAEPQLRHSLRGRRGQLPSPGVQNQVAEMAVVKTVKRLIPCWLGLVNSPPILGFLF